MEKNGKNERECFGVPTLEPDVAVAVKIREAFARSFRRLTPVQPDGKFFHVHAAGRLAG